MNRLLQTFLDGLRDRIVASVASVVGSTFSTFRVAQEAEQQSYLEDLARKYEAEGKPALAEQLRSQAKCLSMDDPAAESQLVMQNVLANSRHLPALPDDSGRSTETREVGRDVKKATTTRRTRKANKPADDSAISLD
jgi:hypothetical protein